ncbi:MAG: hypothetical protein WBX27_09100 [Specibacter sp.]
MSFVVMSLVAVLATLLPGVSAEAVPALVAVARIRESAVVDGGVAFMVVGVLVVIEVFHVNCLLT